MLHQGVHPARVHEADLVLGGMHVDIHLVEGQLQKQGGQGKLAFHQPAAEAFEQRVLDHPVAHPPAVDEKEGAPRGAARQAHRRQVAAQAQRSAFAAHGRQLLGFERAEHIGRPHGSVGGPGPLLDRLAVVDQFDMHLGIAQGHAGHMVGDVSHLGARGFEKLAARRGVEKEAFDPHQGALCGAGFGHLDDLAALEMHRHPHLAVPGPGRQGQMGNGRDAGQGLAPEPQGTDGSQILVAVQFAGGKALHGQQSVVVIHAMAVVGHLDQGAAPVFDIDEDPVAAGVQSVFHQLLDHRGRPLDHLAGGDLVGQDVGQDANAGHGESFVGQD